MGGGKVGIDKRPLLCQQGGECLHTGMSKVIHLMFFPYSEVDPESPEGWSLPLMGIIAGQYRYLQELLQLDSNVVCNPTYS